MDGEKTRNDWVGGGVECINSPCAESNGTRAVSRVLGGGLLFAGVTCPRVTCSPSHSLALVRLTLGRSAHSPHVHTASLLVWCYLVCPRFRRPHRNRRSLSLSLRVAVQDIRACCLCKGTGDGDGAGRLLPLDDGQWIHTHCGLWSSEVGQPPCCVFVCAFFSSLALPTLTA